jgi:two-component system, response regulator
MENEGIVEILLVQDDAAEAELILHTLAKIHLDKHVHVAGDGENALDFIFSRGSYRTRPFNRFLRMVLLDLALPKIGGLEVLIEMKGDPRTATIPVIVLTASHNEADANRAYALGANSYVQRSTNFEEYGDNIQQLTKYWMFLNHLPPNRPK